MLNSKRYLYVAFMCHQAIEKILKAYYWISLNSEPPYTHNLIKLSVNSGLDAKLNEDQKKLINQLIPLNIEARYPTDKIKLSAYLDEKTTKNFFINSKDLLEWIIQLLK